MKPKDKERLVRCRPAMIRSMDINLVLPELRADDSFSKKDEESISADPRRRERVIKFLDILEKKKTEVYKRFLDILEHHFPHIFLMLTDWDQDEGADNTDDPLASYAHLDDDWSILHQARPYLIKEIDAGNLLDYLKSHEVLDEDEIRLVQDEKDRYKRTEAFLDVLEMKPQAYYDIFLDSLGEVYPHVYLAMIDDDHDDDSDLDL